MNYIQNIFNLEGKTVLIKGGGGVPGGVIDWHSEPRMVQKVSILNSFNSQL